MKKRRRGRLSGRELERRERMHRNPVCRRCEDTGRVRGYDARTDDWIDDRCICRLDGEPEPHQRRFPPGV